MGRVLSAPWLLRLGRMRSDLILVEWSRGAVVPVLSVSPVDEEASNCRSVVAAQRWRSSFDNFHSVALTKNVDSRLGACEE
jgi:hypothetical protein